MTEPQEPFIGEDGEMIPPVGATWKTTEHEWRCELYAKDVMVWFWSDGRIVGHHTRATGAEAAQAILDLGAAHAPSGWRPIDTAPKDGFVRILAAGYHRRADPGDKMVVGIIFWSWTTMWRDVPLGNDTFRKERYRVNEGWYRYGGVGNRALDFYPEFWMPLPPPPEGA